MPPHSHKNPTGSSSPPAIRILYKMIRPPVLPEAVDKVRLPRLRPDKIQRLPVRVTALHPDLILQILRHMENIAHEGHRIRKDSPVICCREYRLSTPPCRNVMIYVSLICPFPNGLHSTNSPSTANPLFPLCP